MQHLQDASLPLLCLLMQIHVAIDLDAHHPQRGENIAGRRLVLPGTRGSTSSPGVLVEAIRLGNGPAEIVLPESDLTVLAAVAVARRLYDVDVPVRIKRND